MQKNPLVLVGGLGFIGRNIVDVCQSSNTLNDFSICVVDNMSNAAPGHETVEDVELHQSDYNDPAVVSHLAGISEPKTVIFLAGETRVAESKDRPLDFIEANITEPSRFVMDAIKPGDHFILISTAGALFDGSFRITTESAYCPKNFYGASKAAEEMILEKLVELRGGKFSVVRMTNVYGKFSEKKVSAIHAFTRACLAGEQVTINGDGKQTRDFIYSGDIGRGILTLAQRHNDKVDTSKINMLGSSVSTSLNDIVAGIETATGKKLNYRRIEAAELISTEPRDVMASPDDVTELLGDDITSLQNGLRATCLYYSR